MKNILLFFFSILTISSQAQTIATAYQASFAICDDGTLMSWGDNGDGNLGIPDLVWDTNTPVAVSSLNNVIAVSAGEVHTMALTNVGFVYSWGDDGTGNF